MRMLLVIAGLMLGVDYTLSTTRADERVNGIVTGVVYWWDVPKGGKIKLSGNGIYKEYYSGKDGLYHFSVPPGNYKITAPGPWFHEAFRTQRVMVEEGEIEFCDFWFY